MIAHLSVDLETRSSASIKDTGLYRYAQDEDFDILLLAYSVDDSPVDILDLKCGDRIPDFLKEALEDPNVIKHAHNAAFEWYCLNQYGIRTPLSSWRCDMIHGMYCGYPGSLDMLCKALGVPEDKQKLSVGKQLIRKFCTPRKPTKNNPKKYNDPEDYPEDWKTFKEYCKQDVVTEMENEKRLSAYPVPDSEWHLWHLDVAMNAYGVRVDPEIISGALTINDISTRRLTEEAVAITGLANPNSTQQLVRWLNEQGIECTSVAKEPLAEILEKDIPDYVRRMLMIRKQLGMTSIKKYQAMVKAKCSDDRIRGVSQFYGANRTGRYAGRLIQLQNLTKNHIDTLDFARSIVKRGDYESVEFFYRNVPDLLSQLVRTTFIPSDGNHFVVADFSAIEARVIAWLAGETWAMEEFAGAGKIYEATASQMFGVPIEKIKKGNPEYALRQKGKVAVLACGYGGGTGALINMGAIQMGLKEEDLPDILSRWRKANPNIVKLWSDLDDALMKVMTTAEPVAVGYVILRLEGDLRYGQCFLTVQLPSGRKLYYPKPHLAENRFGNQTVHYYTVNQTTKKWETADTWGGKFAENITQAIARDCLTETLLRIERTGLQTVFHVHDEVIVDAPRYVTDKEICDLMGEPIPWAPGLVLRGAGFTSEYYMKD